MAHTNFIGGSLTVLPDGALLKELRTAQGKTQKQIEDAVGIPNPRLSTYEAGKAISLDHIKRLALYFGAPVETLTKPYSAKIMREMGVELTTLYPIRKQA